MVGSLAVGLFLPLGIVVVAAVLVFTGRGKVKCPDCGTVFATPMMDTKRAGVGLTFPFMGVVKCPKCGEGRPRRDYQKADAPAPPST